MGIEKTITFPDQLRKILSYKEFEDVIAWSPKGKSFFIHDKDRLIVVLKAFHEQETKFDSFRRKLHRYGFKVARKSADDAGAYYHKLFLRDYPSLSANMRMNKVYKGTVLKNKLNNKMKEMPVNSFPIQQNS